MVKYNVYILFTNINVLTLNRNKVFIRYNMLLKCSCWVYNQASINNLHMILSTYWCLAPGTHMFRANICKFAFIHLVPLIWPSTSVTSRNKESQQHHKRQEDMNELWLFFTGKDKKRRFNTIRTMDMAYNCPEMSRIASKTKSDTKCISDTKNESKRDVLTTTSVTKIGTVTNNNRMNKPCNWIKMEHKKLMTEDKDKCHDGGRQYDKWSAWISKIQESRQLKDPRLRLRQICQQHRYHHTVPEDNTKLYMLMMDQFSKATSRTKGMKWKNTMPCHSVWL